MRGDDGVLVRGKFVPIRSGHLPPQRLAQYRYGVGLPISNATAESSVGAVGGQQAQQSQQQQQPQPQQQRMMTGALAEDDEPVRVLRVGNRDRGRGHGRSIFLHHHHQRKKKKNDKNATWCFFCCGLCEESDHDGHDVQQRPRREVGDMATGPVVVMV